MSLDNPKIRQLERDTRAHWPALSKFEFRLHKKCLEVGAEKHWAVSVLLEILVIPVTFLDVYHQHETFSLSLNEDTAEDKAVEEMWKLLRKKFLGYEQCDKPACKVCACFAIIEEKWRAEQIKKLKWDITRLENSLLPLKARLAELESADKK